MSNLKCIVSPNVISMLGHRLRRSSNIKTTLCPHINPWTSKHDYSRFNLFTIQ